MIIKSKIDLTKLGERIHRSNYDFIVGKNDRNEHLGNDKYGNYAEEIRQNRFLPQYGFSDAEFNKKGFRQMRKELQIFYGAGIEEGALMDIRLDLFLKNPTIFHMVFDFIRPDGKLAAKAYSADAFLKKENGVWKPSRKIPQFFIEAIRNV